MTKSSVGTLFVIGACLMCLPGLFTAGMKWGFAAFMLGGSVIFVVATVKSGVRQPKTALTLLIASNVSMWLSYALWVARMKLVGPSPPSGIDCYAGPIALWLFLLVAFLIYEAVIFLWGILINRERAVAALGLVGAILQVSTTIRVVYNMVGGV